MKSGLAPDDLSRWEAARLLLPATKDGRYRPKLADWGKKLAYLLGEGWEIEGIQAWTKGRWKMKNPRKWPPDRNISGRNLPPTNLCICTIHGGFWLKK
jgi:hypothetical protein